MKSSLVRKGLSNNILSEGINTYKADCRASRLRASFWEGDNKIYNPGIKGFGSFGKRGKSGMCREFGTFGGTPRTSIYKVETVMAHSRPIVLDFQGLVQAVRVNMGKIMDLGKDISTICNGGNSAPSDSIFAQYHKFIIMSA